MFETLCLASLFLVFTTVAPHLPGEHWLIRVWEFPRVQLVFLMVLCLAGWGYLYSIAPARNIVGLSLLLIISVIYQCFWIVPYTLLGPREVSKVKKPNEPRVFSILTSNVYMHNTNYQGLIDLVRKHKPAFLVTLESNDDWGEGLEPLHDTYPHRLACPLENLYGMHFYSQLPLKDAQIRYIVEDDVPSMQIEINIDGEPMTLYLLHPKPPSPTENKTAGPRDEELTLVGQEIADKQGPIVVAGDLNDVAWSPTTRKFRKLSHARDPRRGRGFFNTFHAKYPLIRWPLDHVFHTDHFDLVKIQRLPGYGSDHFPLLTTLQLTRTGECSESNSAPVTDEAPGC